ncbi:DUF378 domain-containing protein [Tuberibacillus calidus]|mgnify:CR=1 FL=1|uniref:DUF378 domain-containing protein n=1 Tax=Tuberibacillus calidus TaxID=340097 RepID=UPI00040BE30B|nr:DUF378 domain-containing protein [Tuberibacillus calidus]
MSGLQRTALTILIIGGINWGLVGLFEYDVIGAIFGGQGSAISRILYGIVGLSALYCLTILFKPSEEFGKVPEHE